MRDDVSLLNKISLYDKVECLDPDYSYFDWVYCEFHRFIESNENNYFTVMVF